MTRHLPPRFWFEAITAAAGTVLLVVTLITREWFELLTGIDPDRGNGAFEIGLVVALLAVSTMSTLAARREYVRATVRR